MGRIFAFLSAFLLLICDNAFAAKGRVSRYVDPQSYAYMYPYLNNKMRTAMNPGTTINMTNNPIDVVVKTKRMSEPRRVVPRTPKANSSVARAATGGTSATTQTRRVVQRPTQTTNARAATGTLATTNSATQTRSIRQRGARDDASARTAETTTNITNTPVSSTRCLTDYAACMNGYCTRENTPYNRCYCSAKLSQIDSQYQPQINDLIIQIIKLQGGGTWNEEEMNAYWMEVVGNYAGENSWINLENALNIDWPEPEERMRGQNAFLVGHQYCIQHLRGCAYMSSNLRDAYRSKISRDCATYEQYLERIKNAAESIIEQYQE